MEAFIGFVQTSHEAHTVGLYISSYQGFCDETHTRPGAKIIVDVCYTVLPLEGGAYRYKLMSDDALEGGLSCRRFGSLQNNRGKAHIMQIS